MRALFAAAVPLVVLSTLTSVATAQRAPVAPAVPAASPAPAAAATPTAVAAPAAATVDREAALRFGREIARFVMTGNLDSIMAHADSGTGKPDEVRARVQTALGQLEQQIGTESKMLHERVMLVNGGVQYWRDAEFTGIGVPLVMRVMIAKSGKWRGFTVSPGEDLPPGEEVKPE